MAENTQNEYRLDLCKGYTPQGFAGKVFHLHIRYPGDWAGIIFRNFLKHNPLKAQEYAALKIALQKRFKHNRDAYTETKGDFIRTLCERGQRANETLTTLPETAKKQPPVPSPYRAQRLKLFAVKDK